MDVKFKSLKIFCDVARLRCFSRAAEENQISQSGASQIVKQLESHLGVTLIDRSKRPLVLTAEGEMYFQGCRKLVQRYALLEEDLRTIHEEVEGRITVASIYSVGLSYGPRMVEEFQQRHPKATVNIQYSLPNRVYELVDSEQVDFGLVSFAHSTRTIGATAWIEEPMVLVCAEGHRLTKLPTVRAEDLDGLAVIGFDPNLPIRRNIDRDLEAHEIKVKVVAEFDNIDSIKQAIRVKKSASFLPYPCVKEEVEAGDFVVIDLPDFRVTRPLGIIQRRGVEPRNTVRKLLQLLQSEGFVGSGNGHDGGDPSSPDAPINPPTSPIKSDPSPGLPVKDGIKPTDGQAGEGGAANAA